MAVLNSDKIERKLLSFFFVSPHHMQMVKYGSDLFSWQKYKNLSDLAIKYISKFKAPPTKESLTIFSGEMVGDKSELEKYTDALLVIDELPDATSEEFSFYMDKAENYMIGRSIYDLAGKIKDKFEDEYEVDYRSFRKELLSELLLKGRDDRNIKRGFIYENVKDRWEKHVDAAKGGTDNDLVPFGIPALDTVMGGMKKTYVTLIYSRTSGGKSSTMVNIAYNNALLGKNVVYFSLEMSFDLVAACFDGRMSLVNRSGIIFGKMEDEERIKYKEGLKKQLLEKLGIWLVDIPNRSTTANIYEELETYTAVTGLHPDLVVVDYANLMSPEAPWNGRSERYDFLFQEYHEAAKFFNTALLTASMESRTRSENDKKKKGEEDEFGVEGIGLSNYMAPHCEIVARIKQDRDDKLVHRMWWLIDKNRYGKAFERIELFAFWEYPYVGDRMVPGTGGTLVTKDNR